MRFTKYAELLLVAWTTLTGAHLCLALLALLRYRLLFIVRVWLRRGQFVLVLHLDIDCRTIGRLQLYNRFLVVANLLLMIPALVSHHQEPLSLRLWVELEHGGVRLVALYLLEEVLIEGHYLGSVLFIDTPGFFCKARIC